MPLTNFLKNFLQKLPENIQYLGTDVAPMFGPNWQQAITEEKIRNQQMAQAQQAQANWERQFGAQQARFEAENKQRQAQLEAGLAEHGFLLYQPQQSPGGAGLNQGGASPSFGAGGGAATAPGQPFGPPPSTDNIMNMLYPGWQQFSGQQQTGGQGVNAPSQQPGPVAPGMRMPGMTGDSGAGGGGPMPASIMPTLFNIGERQYMNRPEPSLPIPEALVKMGFPRQMPESWIKTNQQYIDTLVKQSAGQVSPKTSAEADKERAAAYDIAKAHPDDYPKPESIMGMSGLKPNHYDEYIARHNQLGEKPDDQLKRQVEQANLDKLKNELDDYKTNNSPQALSTIVNMIRDNPDYREQVKDPKIAEKVDLEWNKQTGLPAPLPLKGPEKLAESTARTTQNALNRVLTLLEDKDVQSANRIGPVLGRIGQSEQTFGDTWKKMTDAQKSKIQTLRSDLNYLYFQEGKNIFGARIPYQLIQLLKSTAPSVDQVLPMLYGSAQSVQDYINTRMLSADQTRFGGKFRGWVNDRDHNLTAGQLVKAGGQWKRVTSITPTGPVLE